MRTTFLMLALALLTVTACGKQKASSAADSGTDARAYGKPGPGVGESCYAGKPSAEHTCMEIAPNDAAGADVLNTYCTQQNGVRAHGTCSAIGLVGTCRAIPGSAVVKLRYYSANYAAAQANCESLGGKLDRYY